MRYEDVAASAESTVKRVYEWSGLGPVPARVSLWVNENTRLPDCDDEKGERANPSGVPRRTILGTVPACAVLGYDRPRCTTWRGVQVKGGLEEVYVWLWTSRGHAIWY